MENKKLIQVGIRRAAGLLGSRLGHAIRAASDMDLTVGVVLPDRTLDAVLNRCQIIGGYNRSLARQMYIQALKQSGERESAVVRRLNKAQELVHFEGASQLNWKKSCNVIVDTAYPAGKETFAEQYRHFPGIILLQDGATPEGRLIVPPLMVENQGTQTNVYRMGDCILSGIVPLLYPWREMASRIRVHMVTQFDGKEADYLITERAHAFYVRTDLRNKVEDDLSILFPHQEVSVQTVVQIPSLLHYQATLEIDLRRSISHEEVKRLLQEMPRVQVMPAAVSSTYDINLARSFEDTIPPVMVFECALHPCVGERSNVVRIVAAIYYRTAAVLPNIDAIRILTCGTDPIAAMKQTDNDLGFKTLS